MYLFPGVPKSLIKLLSAFSFAFVQVYSFTSSRPGLRGAQKKKPKVARKGGPVRGGVCRGRSLRPTTPPSQFKRLVQGRARSRQSCGRGTCTAPGPGACARAAPETLAAPLAAPRAPPPGERGSGLGSGRERGGKHRTAGCLGGLGGCVVGSRPPRSWPPLAPPWPTPRVGFPQRSFSPAFPQFARTRRQFPAWPGGGGRGAVSRGPVGRNRGRLLPGTSPRPLLVPKLGATRGLHSAPPSSHPP